MKLYLFVLVVLGIVIAIFGSGCAATIDHTPVVVQAPVVVEEPTTRQPPPTSLKRNSLFSCENGGCAFGSLSVR